MPRNAAELAHRLAREAEAVCRHYLSNGRRVGNYWQVGDVRNTAGRSMFVRLKGGDIGSRPAGKWTDAATGEHGDLLDVIRESCGLVDFHDVTEEARRFLSLPRPEPESARRPRLSPVPTGSPESARRLFAMSQPIAGTIVETYLRIRGITALHGIDSLRFHPRCYYRPDAYSPTETWPAMIAAVTDLGGQITGVHRTYLRSMLVRARQGTDRYATAGDGSPSRQRGSFRSGWRCDGGRRGHRDHVVAPLRHARYADGCSTFRRASRSHPVPATLRRLYIVRDNDRGGRWCGGRTCSTRAHRPGSRR